VTTKGFGIGFTLGKFMPPHRGHLHLVREAAARCDDLFVLVCSVRSEPIPGELRAEWMRTLCESERVHVVHVTDEVPSYPHEAPDFDEIWTALLRRHLPGDVEVFFSSDTYGEDVARWLGIRYVSIDPGRTTHPVSATLVRETPLAVWSEIPVPVRGYMLPRIAVVGAESTGKSTLSAQLAHHFEAGHVAEYGREHTANMDMRRFTLDDIEAISAEHARRVEAAARSAYPCLIVDTEAAVTAIWSELYFGEVSGAVERQVVAQRFDLYLLTGSDLPWVDDGTREFPHRREWFNQRLTQRLEDIGARVVQVEGSVSERWALAERAVRALLAEKGFAER
jgi:HTH-type transcriptional regulator, transcriptional repressor of NAD biosynthesis genes